jgi:hypothetical protein
LNGHFTESWENEDNSNGHGTFFLSTSTATSNGQSGAVIFIACTFSAKRSVEMEILSVFSASSLPYSISSCSFSKQQTAFFLKDQGTFYNFFLVFHGGAMHSMEHFLSLVVW